MPDPAPALPRDVRVDTIGYVGELQKQLADGLKTKVKVRMLEGEIERAAGDAFEALVVQGHVGTIDPAKFYKLLKRGEIGEKQFLACVRVNNEAAAEVLGGADVEKISTVKEASPALRVTRIKGVQFELVDALARLNDAVRGPIPGGGGIR